MAVSLAKQASNSTSATPSPSAAAIDLRVADAKWERRQLEGQVELARRRLEELESARDGVGNAFETSLGDLIVGAQNQIARERADARRAAAALMAESELQCRRRLDLARAEAKSLRAVAQALRTQSVGDDLGAMAGGRGKGDAATAMGEEGTVR